MSVCVHEGRAIKTYTLPGKKPTRRRSVFWIPLSKSVHACERNAWQFRFIEKSTGRQVVKPFRCGSWRHAGPCRVRRAHLDRARMTAGFAKHDRWVWVTLTLDPRDWKGRSVWTAYDCLYRMLQKFRQRLQRRYGKFAYISVVQQTKSRQPHVNIALASPMLHEILKEYPNGGFETLRKDAMDCGFGKIGHAVNVRDPGGLAIYLSHVVSSGTEKEYDQAPTAAPPRFRRIRASRGLLPKERESDGSWTGGLERVEEEERCINLSSSLEPVRFRVGSLSIEVDRGIWDATVMRDRATVMKDRAEEEKLEEKRVKERRWNVFDAVERRMMRKEYLLGVAARLEDQEEMKVPARGTPEWFGWAEDRITLMHFGAYRVAPFGTIVQDRRQNRMGDSSPSLPFPN